MVFSTTINIPSDYTTIQAGINASVDGDTVLVAQGTYSENLILEKEIVLASHALNDDLNTEWINNENIQETIISGPSEPVDPNYGSCLVIRDGNIAPTIFGFTFRDGIGTAMVENDTCELVVQRPERSGGAVLIYKAYPTIMYNRFINNGSVQADSGNGSIAVTNGGAIGQFSDEDVEFDEDRNNARRIRHSSRNIPEEVNIQNNYFENNSSGDGKNFYSRGYEGSIDVSYSIFDDIDCESNSVNEFVLKSKEKEAAYIQNDISGNCIEENSFYVSMDGNNNNPGTESEPFKTIGHSLSLVKDDSSIPTTIYVGDGVFSPSTTGEQFPIILPDYVHLIGASRETSILDAEADLDKESRVIKIVEECENIKVANFTITGGNAVSAGCIGGGGILVTHPDLEYVYDGPVSPVNAVFENLIVTDNSTAAGGGISIWRVSGPTLSNLIIQENTSEYYGGGLMIFTAVASVTDVTVSGNNCSTDESYGGGIIINNSEVTLTNVTVTDNTASFGGGIFILDTDAALINLTVRGNTATALGGGLFVGPNTNPMLTNSIIWGNDPTQIQGFGTPTITYSDIQGGWEGDGNIDTDPLFVDADNGDYTLQQESPCIDAGTADIDGDGNEDITNYFGTAPDMGAYEFYIAITGLQYTIENASVNLEWDSIENFQYYKLERSTDSLFITGVETNYLQYNTYTDNDLEFNTEYFYRVSAYVNDFWTDYSNVISVMLENVNITGTNDIPTVYKVHQNHPNPFNPVTTLRYDLPQDAIVNISIYDMMGRVVNNLVSSQQNAGYKSIQWHATNNAGQPVSAGIYLYTIFAGEFRQTKKMVMLK